MANHATATCPREADVVMLLLGTAEPYDAPPTRHHLQTCPYCQATAADAAATFDALADTVDPIRPPDRLRERILTAAADSVPTVAPTPITAARSARRARHRGSRWATAAAAAAAIVALGGGGAWMVQLEQQRDAATAQAGTLTDVLGQIVRSPHAVLVDRDGHPLLAVAVDGPTLRVYDLGLPPAAAGRVWTLWGMRGADATRLGTIPGDIAAGGEYEAYGLSQESGETERPRELVATGPVMPPSS